MNRCIGYLLICIVALSFLCGCFDTPSNNLSPAIIVDGSGKGDYVTIQNAIDNCPINGMIKISEGIYNENIEIDKTIKIIGLNVDTCIIDGSFSGDVIVINASNVSIVNITIQNSGKIGHFSDNNAGIEIKANSTIIKSCIIHDNFAGIDIRSSDNTISNCLINNNSDGIFMVFSQGNVITHNSFDSNKHKGLYIHSGSKNQIKDENHFVNNEVGLKIKSSNQNQINLNEFQMNQQGMSICCSSKGNIVYENIFVNNSEKQADDSAGPNYWYNITLKRGNYWSDYTGEDNNNDGIGDVSYVISSKGVISDKYPLIEWMIDS